MKLCILFCAAIAGYAQSGGELRFAIHNEPKTFEPALAADSASETIRYLTGGVLMRMNRKTQALENELATSIVMQDHARTAVITIRTGLAFSDGTPFTSEDVAYTFRTLLAPGLHSPLADSFRSGAGAFTATTQGPAQVTLHFPAPVSTFEQMLDQVAIVSSRSPLKSKAVLGPFFVADYRAGSYVLLKRNPHYWKRDAHGQTLPYLDSVRLSIESNHEAELMHFEQGQLDLISGLEPDHYDLLARKAGFRQVDAGTSLDAEVLWFNQSPTAPIPEHERAWFASRNFRLAISHAIERGDLCRVVYRGHATPGVGPASPANRFWFNAKLKAHTYDLSLAQKLLAEDGFHKDGDTLRDRGGHAVEFSLITNAGNRDRERMAAMLQEDLRKIGVRLNVVPLDFPSLIDRISQNFRYESCLLGFSNVDLDPSGQMNIWLSSADQHQWNPNQKHPATAWEAELDRLMQDQAAALDPARRKSDFDAVQQIVSEQAPFLYLVNKNALVASSPSVANLQVSVLSPQAYWNIEWIQLSRQSAMNRPH